jgi:hypothetical protein
METSKLNGGKRWPTLNSSLFRQMVDVSRALSKEEMDRNSLL